MSIEAVAKVGVPDGRGVGDAEGLGVGDADGLGVGDTVGSIVGPGVGDGVHVPHSMWHEHGQFKMSSSTAAAVKPIFTISSQFITTCLEQSSPKLDL